MSEEQQETQTFTQEDVDRIVKERLDRFSKKFSDYDDLKAKAEQSRTLEDRIGELEKQTSDANLTALRATVAGDHGITAEDRDLFLTGTDLETLTAQAKRLGERVSEQQKQGGVAPLQGSYPQGDSGDSELREFTRSIFKNTADA